MLKRRNTHLVAIAALVCAITAGSAAQTAGATTKTDLRREARALSGASGAFVADVTTGTTLLNKRGGVPRILASNAKLFTAAATLDRFGADERFITSLWTDGTVENGVLNGNVYLRGGGDPLFGDTSYVRKYFGSGATVQQLALAATIGGLTGITDITGRVYGDEALFDPNRGTATYAFRRSGEIGGQLGALIFNKGFTGGSFQSNPPRFAAQRMRAALKQSGVPVDGGTAVGETPAGARLLAYVESLPVSRLVRLMDKPSNNYLAEMLVKSLAMPVEAVSGGGAGASAAGAGGSSGGTPPTAVSGDPVLTSAAPATTRAGAGAARDIASVFGSRVALGDGSGLSRTDRAAPREVVDLLRGMASHAAFTPFDESLPIPGVDGTLASRMRGTDASKRCRAKTGTLSNVSALSGYCTTAGGHLIAFSILNNRIWPPTARNAQDRLVKTIAKLE